jgi:hypothetical protein
MCISFQVQGKEQHRLKISENRVLREHLDLRERQQNEDGENCIMRNFIIYTFQQTLLG